jgi:hypothetical protein
MSYEDAMTVCFEKPCRILSQDAQGRVLVSPEGRQLPLEKYDRLSPDHTGTDLILSDQGQSRASIAERKEHSRVTGNIAITFPLANW